MGMGANMRALVTGGSGFIGSHVVDSLLNKGFEVRIFDMVYPKYEQAGVGVGLTIARGLARVHKGDIVVESQHGAGSRFTLWLPVETDD